ncbi:MAG: type II secretion system minor pseudopilin GspJ, partial [Pseudomonadota bacterium]|nr:type II secretion system minor pseudopilin GspJ [Pseudomonadota bacterium]
MSAHQQRIQASAVRGFTLIEVLVSVLIFALMSAAAYAAIDALLRSRQALYQRAQSLQQLQTAMGRFERDLRQAMTEPVRDAYGETQPLLSGTSTSVELTRAGLANPLGQTRAR